MKWMRRVVADLEVVEGRDEEGMIMIYVLGEAAAAAAAEWIANRSRHRHRHRHLDMGGERVMVA
jgi:hypothetical protein